MQKFQRILLASHGTPGACAAEDAAFELAPTGCQLFHLVVVPDFWEGMQGDDWLNNAATRDVFAKHVETQLEKEVNENIARVRAAAKVKNINYASQMVYGNPAECLLAYAKHIKPDLVVLGALRPKGKLGYRSRMLNDAVLRNLAVALFVAPLPGQTKSE